jgi:hypothetical protein
MEHPNRLFFVFCFFLATSASSAFALEQEAS